MSHPSPIIRLKSISKRFGKTQALSEINLEIPEGLVFALLGENGAGKSTMIRILTGFLDPDQGEAEVIGHSIKDSVLEIRQGIGYVSDSPALYDWMTVTEIGWFTSGFYDEAFLKQYKKLVTELDLPSDTKIKHLSKGQRSKVSLALATSHDPRLLILDEPTSGLDPMVRRQFLESMVDRTAAGNSVFLSSHHISEIERVADWIGILHEGELKLVKPLEEIHETTSIITVTLNNPNLPVPLPPGQILSESCYGKQRRWVIQDCPREWTAQRAPNENVTRIEVKQASLEDIFVAICDHPRPSNRVIEDSVELPLQIL